jgi:hypothetical protein
MTIDVRIYRTAGVTNDEVSVGEDALRVVAGCLPIPVLWRYVDDAQVAAEWMANCTKLGTEESGQVDVECVLKTQIPYTKARHAVETGAAFVETWIPLVITEHNLVTRDSPFLFGGGLPELGAIISVRQLRKELSSPKKELVLRRLIVQYPSPCTSAS